ncbi:MAG: hypothetical protein MK033_11395 [Candidatus Caenarcaniphilales bacterium]|nr:hypothetical protein [Candidatus Caenarcaniphilales bacterium]
MEEIQVREEVVLTSAANRSLSRLSFQNDELLDLRIKRLHSGNVQGPNFEKIMLILKFLDAKYREFEKLGEFSIDPNKLNSKLTKSNILKILDEKR